MTEPEPTGTSMEDLAATIDRFMAAAAVALENLLEPLAEAFRRMNAPPTYGLDDAILRDIATPRQWHLLHHGSQRVRKKWRRALWRKFDKGE